MLNLMMSNIFGYTHSLYHNATVISPMPPSWIVGLLMNVHAPLDLGVVPILLPVDAPLPMSAEYIDKVHTTTRAKGVFYVPSLLKELSRNQTYIDHMRHLSFVAFGGASLDREVGELFRSFCHLQPTIGSTEVGGYGVKSGDNEDWPYFEFNPMTGFQFLPFQDDLYESVVVKHSDAEMASTQMVFFVFPELDVFHTKDVWREHPTKKGLWTMCGRTDDFVKLSSLTKFNGTHVEEAVLRHPLVKDVIMGGEGRRVPFLLVGLVDDGMDCEEALGQIWPVIDGVNDTISPEIRLKKEMVLFTTPVKPMKRVGKGTVNRRLTLKDYADEIEKLYQEGSHKPS
jgi:acyl-coenzyme A synthetase/AMP-(fatty) acid ligase